MHRSCRIQVAPAELNALAARRVTLWEGCAFFVAMTLSSVKSFSMLAWQ